MGNADSTLTNEPDVRSVYTNCCQKLSDNKIVILVGSQRVE